MASSDESEWGNLEEEDEEGEGVAAAVPVVTTMETPTSPQAASPVPAAASPSPPPHSTSSPQASSRLPPATSPSPPPPSTSPLPPITSPSPHPPRQSASPLPQATSPLPNASSPLPAASFSPRAISPPSQSSPQPQSQSQSQPPPLPMTYDRERRLDEMIAQDIQRADELKKWMDEDELKRRTALPALLADKQRRLQQRHAELQARRAARIAEAERIEQANANLPSPSKIQYAYRRLERDFRDRVVLTQERIRTETVEAHHSAIRSVDISRLQREGELALVEAQVQRAQQRRRNQGGGNVMTLPPPRLPGRTSGDHHHHHHLESTPSLDKLRLAFQPMLPSIPPISRSPPPPPPSYYSKSHQRVLEEQESRRLEAEAKEKKRRDLIRRKQQYGALVRDIFAPQTDLMLQQELAFRKERLDATKTAIEKRKEQGETLKRSIPPVRLIFADRHASRLAAKAAKRRLEQENEEEGEDGEDQKVETRAVVKVDALEDAYAFHNNFDMYRNR